MATTPTAAWRSRIVGSGQEAPDQLLANPLNWRTHPANQRNALRGSLDTVGWVQQVMVNRRTGFVVDGHARVEEALSRGEASVPVLYVDLSPEEEALVLATLDPIGAMAGRDQARLNELLADIAVDDEGLLALLGSLSPTAKVGLTDPDDAPDLGEQTNIKRGDTFALGDHRLMCGDATRDLPTLMAGTQADCVWTDPPYGVAYVGKTKAALTLANDDVTADGLVRNVFAAARAFLPSGAPFYCAGPSGPHSLGYQLAIVAAGFRLHEELVWVKDVFVLGHSDYHYQHEPIFYGYAPGNGRPGRGRHEGTRWYGDHAQASVFMVDRPKRSEQHPTMKPVALVASMVANSTPVYGAVLDPFVGSGSTIIAAEQLGRRCYAMDIDPRYVAVAIERWENFTGRTSERVDG
jgi:DNA modification methylase